MQPKGWTSWVPGALSFLKDRIAGIDDDKEVTREIWVLDKLGDHRDVRTTILGRASEQPSIWMRTASEAGTEGDKSVEPLLISGLGCTNARVRQCAARVLEKVGGKGAVPFLIKALADVEWDVRRAAVSALVGLGESALDQLHVALSTDERRIKVAVAEILGVLGNQSSLQGLAQALNEG